MEQVAHTGLQATQVDVTESKYLLVAQPQKPVAVMIIWVDGQVAQVALVVQVAQDEWQATQTLLTLL